MGLTVYPSFDSYLYQGATTTNYQTQTGITVGWTTGSGQYTGVLVFPIASVGLFTKCSLRLYVATKTGAPGILHIQRLTNPNAGYGCTWVNACTSPSTVAWNGAGCTGASDYTSTNLVNIAASAWAVSTLYTTDITAQVQDSRAIADSYHRIRLTTDYVASTNYTFAAVDHATVSYRPILIFEYNGVQTIVPAMSLSAGMADRSVLGRSLGGPVSLAQAFTRKGTLKRTVTGLVALTAALARVSALKRTVTGSVALAGATAKFKAAFKTLSGSIGLTGAVIAARSKFVTITGSIATAAGLSRALALRRTISATTALTDTVKRVLAAYRVIPGSVAIASSVTRRLLVVRAILGSVSVRAALTAGRLYTRYLVAPMQLSASLARSVGTTVYMTASVGLSTGLDWLETVLDHSWHLVAEAATGVWSHASSAAGTTWSRIAHGRSAWTEEAPENTTIWTKKE